MEKQKIPGSNPRPIKRKPHRPHWYRLCVLICPVCGTNNSYRERVYGTKQSDEDKRRIYKPEHASYCGCMNSEFY